MYESINAIHETLDKVSKTENYIYCKNCMKIYKESELIYVHNSHGAEFGICPVKHYIQFYSCLMYSFFKTCVKFKISFVKSLHKISAVVITALR